MHRDMQELTARDVFNTLVKQGKSVLLDLPNEKAAQDLLNNLNVIKSREWKLFNDLGLDFENLLIRLNIVQPLNDSQSVRAKFFTELPRKKKTFTGFVIVDSDKTNG